MTELYVAAYTYSSPEPGDLSFAAGDIITVSKKDAEWWTGTFNDKSGVFPANYVTKYEGAPPTAAADNTQLQQPQQQQLQQQVEASLQEQQQQQQGLDQQQVAAWTTVGKRTGGFNILS